MPQWVQFALVRAFSMGFLSDPTKLVLNSKPFSKEGGFFVAATRTGALNPSGEEPTMLSCSVRLKYQVLSQKQMRKSRHSF